MKTDIETFIHAVRLAAGNNQFTIELCGQLAELCTLALEAAERKLQNEALERDLTAARAALQKIRKTTDGSDEAWDLLARVDEIADAALAQAGPATGAAWREPSTEESIATQKVFESGYTPTPPEP